ncbi:hypothetical protein H5410_056570 [Solanum commersonii]|uniref:Cytochrome c assembly protein domain-containing protein n=1 Tax=Solanum commersonii TaxID=4109 RepID=A0A9J5WMM4_SOLCO|nr:hypothetical protein H5410_056570 [Solanum commersonii]
MAFGYATPNSDYPDAYADGMPLALWLLYINDGKNKICAPSPWALSDVIQPHRMDGTKSSKFSYFRELPAIKETKSYINLVQGGGTIAKINPSQSTKTLPWACNPKDRKTGSLEENSFEHGTVSPLATKWRSVISLSRTTQSLRKLIVIFYRSGGCCEEILESSKEKWAYAGSISQGTTTTAWLGFDTQATRLAKEDRCKVAGRDRGTVTREGQPDRGLPAIGNGTTVRGVGEGFNPPPFVDHPRLPDDGNNKAKFGNEHKMSIYELFHYSLFRSFRLHSLTTRNNHKCLVQRLAFWCILLSFLGLSFRHIPNNLSNYNVLTANAPFFYQISGTWSNHEGSILSWCRILSFYGFLLCYRGRPLSHNNSILSLPRYEQKSGIKSQLYTPFVLRILVDSELCSQRNQTFDGPSLFYAPLYPKRKMSFASLGVRRSHGSREGKRMLHLARDDKERASSIDEQRIDGALGIALFFSPFLLASFDPFVRNFFLCTEPLVESNPVPQDPISAIHPPCIYAGDVASAMGFGLCR